MLLDLGSALGFVTIFKLVFAAGERWARNSRIGLCVLAAITLLLALSSGPMTEGSTMA